MSETTDKSKQPLTYLEKLKSKLKAWHKDFPFDKVFEFADEETKPLKEEIKRLETLNGVNSFDIAKLESSLSIAKKENEDFRDYIIKKDFDNRKLIEELTSVKEQNERLVLKNADLVIINDSVKEQKKELADALDEVVIYLGDEKTFERAERFLIKKIRPALTNYQQAKP